ncbi:MAG: hypothetical protein AB1749_11675 [Pseudomonadota bacterium]
MRRVAILLVVLAAAFYGVWPALSLYQLQLAFERGDGDLLARKVDLASVAAGLAPLAVPADAIDPERRERARAALARPAALLDLFARAQEPSAALSEIVAGIVRAAPAGLLVPSATVADGRSKAGAVTAPGDRPASPFRTLSEAEAEQKTARRQQQAPAASPVRTLSAGEAEQRAERTAAQARQTGSPVRTLSAEEAEAKQQGRRVAAPSAATSPSRSTSAPPPARAIGFANLRRIAPKGPLSISVGLARDAASAGSDLTAELAFRGFDWKLVALGP